MFFLSLILTISLATSADESPCNWILHQNSSPQETPFLSYNRYGLSFVANWLEILDPSFDMRIIPPSMKQNHFFKKYFSDRGTTFENTPLDGQERWVQKYLLWALDRINRSVINPQTTMKDWLESLTHKEWDEDKIIQTSIKNKSRWQKMLAEKFPVLEPLKKLENTHVDLIPTLNRKLYFSTSTFHPPLAANSEHHRYGFGNVPNPFWGQMNAVHSTLIGIKLQPLFQMTKAIQDRQSNRNQNTYVNRGWINKYGVVFPIAPEGTTEDVHETLDLQNIKKYSDLAEQLMTLQDFEEICNEYFQRLYMNNQLSENDSVEVLMAKLKILYFLMGTKEFSIWVGPVIPANRITF